MKGFNVKTLIILLLLFNSSICAPYAQNLPFPSAHESLSLLTDDLTATISEQLPSEYSSAPPATLVHETSSLQDIGPLLSSPQDISAPAVIIHERPALYSLDSSSQALSPTTHEPSSVYVEYEPSWSISADSPQVTRDDGKDKPRKTVAKVSIGNWNEWDRLPNRKGDYAFNYYAVIVGKLQLRYDYFNLDRSRYWVNYGQIALIKSSWLNFNYSPGVMWVNGVYSGRRKEIWFYGGHFMLSLPKLGFSVLHKGYGSNEGPFQQTFADLSICKYLDLSGYNLSTLSASPDTYLGPKLKIPAGSVQFNIWYGISTNPSRPDAKLLNCATHITF